MGTPITRRMGKLREFSCRELKREELVRLHEPRAKPPTIQKLRDSHHNVARLVASGLRHSEIAERTGYSLVRINTLVGDPAFQQLVAEKRTIIDEAWRETQDEYQSLMFKNMIAAERHVADRIDEMDEQGELLPLKSALAISRDAADRLGYGKKQTNLNVNVDFAKNLEATLRRSGKAGTVLPPAVPGPTVPATTLDVTASRPLAPQPHDSSPQASEAGAAPMRRIA